MKNFKDYIAETVIKLRGFDGAGGDKKEASQRFIDDLHASSKPHPLNNNARIVGDAVVHVSGGGDGVRLHDIHTLNPKSGAGTEALSHLKSLADRHNVPIHGLAKAYDKDKSKITSTNKLKSWYEKHGFKTHKGDSKEGYHITYRPKRLH